MPFTKPSLSPEVETESTRSQAVTAPARIVAASNWLWAVWRRIAVRRRTSILLVSGLALGIGYLHYAWHGFPDPAVHDEFSYLLAADTFALGRVTNPTHPMWVHFESFHILQRPTYTSIYPVAQGLLLGASQRIFGHPWWGVWLSAGFMCGAICWALQQWLPAEWALIGGLFSLRLAYSYWMTSYYGGALGAIGGALLMGGAGQWVRRPSARATALMALGIAILASTRPYEGAIFSGVVCSWLIWRWLEMSRIARRVALRRSLLPIIAILGATALLMAYYCWRVTGNPVTLPYQVYFRTYLSRAMFIWQKNRPTPLYNHPMMKDGFAFLDRANATWRLKLLVKYTEPLSVFFPLRSKPVLALSPLALFLLLRKRTRPLFVLAASVFVALALEYWGHPHYVSPGTAATYGVAVALIQRFSVWPGKAKTLGPVFAQILVLSFLASIPFGIASLLWSEPVFNRSFPKERLRIENELENKSGLDLVIVRYGSDHDPNQEWVYNAADIDASPVVWARDSERKMREQLIAYFHDRRVWILEPDHDTGPRLYPYVPCEKAGGPSYMPAVLSACY